MSDISSIPQTDLPRAIASLGALRNEYIQVNKGQKAITRIATLIRDISALMKPSELNWSPWADRPGEESDL
jgi:hypothetical protein